jgi:hypothetical protein
VNDNLEALKRNLGFGKKLENWIPSAKIVKLKFALSTPIRRKKYDRESIQDVLAYDS